MRRAQQRSVTLIAGRVGGPEASVARILEHSTEGMVLVMEVIVIAWGKPISTPWATDGDVGLEDSNRVAYDGGWLFT